MADRVARRRCVERAWGWVSPTYRALGLTFRVRIEDAGVAGFLGAALAPFEVVGGEPVVGYDVFDDSADRAGRWVVLRDGEPVGVPGTRPVALQWFFWDLNRAVVEASRDDFLLVHAGAVARNGAAVLLPGPPGCGKTTLTAALLRSGFAYLSDESPALEAVTGLLHPYPKALSVEIGAREALADLEPRGAERPPSGWAWDQWIVDPRAVSGSGGIAGPVPVRMVVFPEYVGGAETWLEPLPRAQAVLLLAANSFNFGDRPAAHLRAVAALVGGATCHRLTSGEAAAAATVVAAAFDAAMRDARQPAPAR